MVRSKAGLREDDFSQGQERVSQQWRPAGPVTDTGQRPESACSGLQTFAYLRLFPHLFEKRCYMRQPCGERLVLVPALPQGGATVLG